MATNTVNGILVCSDGTNIPLKKEIAESSEAELTTDTAYTVSAVSVGDYAPGKTVTRGLVQADNGISYAYILRQGLVAAIISVGLKGICNNTPALNVPFTLQAGDKVQVLTETSSARDAALCVFTNRGTARIFKGTPASGTTTELTDLKTGNSIGSTLQGEVCTAGFFTSLDGSKIESPGVVIVDALGNVVGSVATSDPAKYQAQMVPLSAPIDLNYVAQILTNA
tara:strand:- start:218 stop:892 length:675 start_codon:yes stop_codon:yes gene_type:complete